MGSSHTPSFWRFDSPLIYLFAGITLILSLIVVALIILACSQRKRRPAEAGGDVESGGEPRKTVTAVYNGGDGTDNTPKVVVIMAGDELPTYLATPAASGDVAGDTGVSN
ncbi:hypothetical protein L6452_41396 [Arctium lappa]|uniref:Uncharacterized protein n=1 Tax=Arctium lappa TaxID=4217 RepID=A0ACB8XNA4_ARCLA|nr:hypothetical protein L6452_41396 [Arctium lappa]